MKIVAAYLLAVLGGNPNPSADDLTSILSSGCVSTLLAKCAKFSENGTVLDLDTYPGTMGFIMCNTLIHLCVSRHISHHLKSAHRSDVHSFLGIEADGDRIETLLSQVRGKDITELIAAGREKLSSVPAGGGAVAVSATPAGGAGGAAAAEPAKEEKKVEEKEESDDDMGFSLFD